MKPIPLSMHSLPQRAGAHGPEPRENRILRPRGPLAIRLFPLLLACLFSAGCGRGLSGAGASSWLGVDVVAMITRSDPVGKICLAVTFLFSVATWAIIIYKFLHIRTAMRQTNRFVSECMAGTGSLEDSYRNAAAYPDSPLAQILREAYLELEIEDWYRVGYSLSDEQRVEVAKVGVDRVLERTISNEMAHLESNLIVLAVASNACPFIGLFGTVWGIMATFQALGVDEAAALSALAPGIATALSTTVAGLAVAIPATIMYNYFTAQVQLLTSRMDSFSLELSNVIQKQLLKQDV